MQPSAIVEQVARYRESGKRVFASSSFQTQSIVLLHILSEVRPRIPVVFLNTGYHFPETIAFRDKIAQLLGLDLVDLRPQTPKFLQIGGDGRLLFASDPDHCCELNKIQPMEGILREYDVWINGVRGDQNASRGALRVEEAAPFGVVRFHPLLGWSARDIHMYRVTHNLPAHPLEEKGYVSIGCEPCTRRVDLSEDGRAGRWYGLKKTECGLQTDLLKKSA